MDLTLLLPLGLLVLMMIFMWRSNKKRTAAQQDLRAKIQPGAEIMTQSGIFGTLLSIDEATNVATVETSPGVLIRVHQQTIAHVVEPTVDVPNDASSLTGDADESANSGLNDSADSAGNTDSTDNDGDISNDDRPKA